MTQQVFSIGEKVYKGRTQGMAYTVELVDGDSAVITGPGGRQIVKLDELTPVVRKASDGWFTIKGLNNFAYFVEWNDKNPVFKWGLEFSTGKISQFPTPMGWPWDATAFNAYDFTPVKLTTAVRYS